MHATGFRFDEVRAVAIEDSVAKVTGVCAVYCLSMYGIGGRLFLAG